MKNIQKYRFLESIGKGKFGHVYKGENTITGELVAIKLEIMQQNSIKMLKHEATILNYLFTNKCESIPLVYWFGKHENLYGLIMPYYELSLDKYAKILMEKCISASSNTHEILKYTDDRYDLLLNKCLNILRDIHSSYVVHRDIKPQNFMIQKDRVVLIDFGMATFFVDEQKNHIEPLELKKTNILGTSRYISINLHHGEEYTRRDDMISLGYMFLNLYTGGLPWDAGRSQYVSHEYEITNITHPYNQYLKREKEWSVLEAAFNAMCKTPFINRIHQYLKDTYQLEFSELPDYYL